MKRWSTYQNVVIIAHLLTVFYHSTQVHFIDSFFSIGSMVTNNRRNKSWNIYPNLRFENKASSSSFVCFVCAALNCSLEFIHGILFISILVMVLVAKKSNVVHHPTVVWWFCSSDDEWTLNSQFTLCSYEMTAPFALFVWFFFYFISTMLRFYSQRKKKK